MKDLLTFTLYRNWRCIEFAINEFSDGFAWTNDYAEGEGFPTVLEAQQDAINFMQNYGFREDLSADDERAEKTYRYATTGRGL